MHVLTATTKTSKQTPGSCRDRNESVVSFGYTWPVMGSKAQRPSLRPPDRSRNPYKSPPDRSRNPYKSPPDRSRNPYKSPLTIFFSFTSLMSPFVLTTPGHLEHHIEHHTRWYSLSLWVIFNIIQEGLASFFEFHHHTNASEGLCVSYPSDGCVGLSSSVSASYYHRTKPSPDVFGRPHGLTFTWRG